MLFFNKTTKNDQMQIKHLTVISSKTTYYAK